MPELFIAGVGTGVGKTLVTTILCHQLGTVGRPVSAIKPVVSGFSVDDADSDPALIVRSLGGSATPDAMATIAPWRFKAPLSPHLAARREGRSIDLHAIVSFCREHESGTGKTVLVEGAGGVMSPVTEEHTCLDLIVLLGYPVVLVTGSYLGAISHTLTALCALRASRVGRSAIVISESAGGAGLDETARSLAQFGRLDRPPLVIPRLPGEHEHKWRVAPSLLGLCDLDHV
jgi:dethiobiotin synthetase